MNIPPPWRETAQQFFKFGIVGAVGFVVDSAFLYFGIYALGFGRVTAGLFSFPFAVTATWIGNRHFTFRDAPPMPAVQQLAKFAAVCAVGLVFNRGTYSLLVSTVPFVYDHPIIGLLAGTGAGMFFNFFAARRHVFGG
jgi:putative flippase GtrA